MTTEEYRQRIRAAVWTLRDQVPTEDRDLVDRTVEALTKSFAPDRDRYLPYVGRFPWRCPQVFYVWRPDRDLAFWCVVSCTVRGFWHLEREGETTTPLTGGLSLLEAFAAEGLGKFDLEGSDADGYRLEHR
jgi:hypothetical protein